MKTEAAPRRVNASYNVAAIFLLAATLRAPLTGVGPVLEDIRSDLDLSGAGAGLLATLPLLMFAVASPFVRLAQVFGIERTLAGSLAAAAAGIALRSAGSIATLFGGTVIFGIGIGIANILAPSLIKRDFPGHIEGMTTAYLMVMALAASVATGISAPLAAHLAGGWRSSLAVWAALAAFTLLCWLPQARKSSVPGVQKPDGKVKPLWRSTRAWHVTVFMGVQSLVYYVMISWMPTYLADHGMTPADAGFLLTAFQIVSFAVGFAVPALLRRCSDQRLIAVALSLFTMGCLLGLAAAPQFAILWLCLCGMPVGATFILAFAFIGMRTADHRQAASLSNMSQATGYLIAAAGPVAFGGLHDLTAGWTIPLAGLIALLVVQAVAGYGAGRQGHV